MLRDLPFASLLLCSTVVLAQTRPPAPATVAPADPDPARTFFAKGEIVHFDLVLDPTDRRKLKDKPREYVPCTIKVDGKETWLKVGIKLKGAAGSFREIDDHPGFTVNLGKFGEQQRFHGLNRFHLNNGAQDDSRLSEWLGYEVFTAAGRPAPRVAHARVSLDGQDLGIYVLREAFDKQFLWRVFGNTHGNLYDGGFCQDIDQDLQKDAGDGPDDHSDLHRLLELCRDFDVERTTRYEQIVDVDAMIDFCALEAMLGHWDGYSQNRNNFRLWFATAPARAVFLPHGMDQLLGDADASILHYPSSLVANALMQNPVWRKRYRERLKLLLPVFAPQKIVPRLKVLAQKVHKELQSSDPRAANNYDDAVRNLIDRIEARYRNLQTQVRAPEPKPVQFPGNRPIALRTWHPAGETDRIELGKKGFQGVTTLTIASTARGDEPVQGAWRTTMLLGQGRYRLLGTARCDKVEGPPKDADGTEHGGVRLCVDDQRSEKLFGDTNWKPLVCEFEVGEYQRDVELRLELRAMAGRAWFRLDTLQIEKVPD
jgi:spore coat protein H